MRTESTVGGGAFYNGELREVPYARTTRADAGTGLAPDAGMNRGDPRVGEALERAYEASQSLIVQRIDLLVAESKLLAQSGAMRVLGAAVALTGWIFLVHGMIDGLAQRYPRFAVEIAVGVAHAVLAVLLFLRSRSLGDE